MYNILRRILLYAIFKICLTLSPAEECRNSEVLDVNLTNDFIEATDRIRGAARLVEIKR